MTVVHPPRHIVWSTNQVDLSDPFQRRWYLQQVLTHGRAEDIRSLDLEEIRRELDELDLPPEVHSLWKSFLMSHHVKG
jgi:hypothetical protein